MDPRLPLRGRRALPWALALAILSPGAIANATTARELSQARDRIDRTSAELAQARTRAERLGGRELLELARVERRLQAEKDALLVLESDLEAEDAASGGADVAPEPGLTPPSTRRGRNGEPLIVLSEPAAPPSPSPAPTVRTVAGQQAQEVVPAVAGSDAELTRSIDGYLAATASPLTGLGAVFVNESRAVGLDPRALVAISGAETSFGTYRPSQDIHNPFGMGPGIDYPSWSDAIRAAARNLGGSLYFGDGRVTIGAIQQRWAPNGASNDPTDLNSNWARNVSTYYRALGGDPLGSLFTAAASPSASASVSADTAPAVGAPIVVPPPGRSGRGADAAQTALSALGAEWAEGGSDRTTGFDDASLVRWAYARHDVALPQSRIAQATAGAPIAPEALAAGDAIFFSDEAGAIVHVGIYVGAGQFVHSPGDGSVVRISSLYDPAFAAAYAGARRF